MNRCLPALRFVRGWRALLGIGLMLGSACAAAQAVKNSQPVVIPTTQYGCGTGTVWPNSFVVGDLDGDGKPDFVYSGLCTGLYAGNVLDTPLFNNGDGTFSLPIGAGGSSPGLIVNQTIAPVTKGGRPVLIAVYSFPGIPASLEVVPITASRVTDTANIKNSLFTLLGSTSATVTAMAVADVNGDGANDVIAEDSGGYLYVLLNDGTGLFTLKTSLALPTGAVQLLVDDFDLDGIPDVATLEPDGNIIVELSDGMGGFKGTRTYTVPGGPGYSMLYADIDGDGLKDLVVEGVFGTPSAILGTPGYGPSETSGPIVLENNNQGRTNEIGGHLIAIADLNGDGIADIVTSNPAGVYVMLGQGSYTYKPSLPYNVGPGRTSYALADFNGDGKLDLAVDSPEGIAILYGNGDGTFQAGHSFDTFSPALSLALADFRAKDVLDAIVATGIGETSYLQGDGKGNFLLTATDGGTDAAQTRWPHLVAGDFDGDGILDFAMSTDGPLEFDLGPCCTYPASDNSMKVVFGVGNKYFGAPVPEGPATSGAHYGMLLAADLNGDGVSDLLDFDANLAGGYQGGPGAQSGSMLLINEFGVWGDGYLRPYQQIATGYLTPGRTKAPDVVVESLSSSLSFSVQKNDGKGTFSDGQQTFALPSGIAVLDGTSTLPPTGLYPSALLLADLDGDGYGDFLVLYHNLAADPTQPDPSTANLLYIFWGNGDGTFASTPQILTLPRNYYQMALADVDGDAKPDLVLSDGYLVSVMSNDESRQGFAKETHYLAGMGINALQIAPVTGTGSSDIVVATGGAVFAAGVINKGRLAKNGEVNTGGLTVLPGTAGTAPVTSTGTLVATPESVVYDTAFTLTATLNAASGGALPTGTVTFSVGSTVECSAAPVVSGIATCIPNAAQYGALNVGPYTLTGAYSGDANYSASTLTGTLTVARAPTVTTLVTVPTLIYYGQVIGDGGFEGVSPYPGGGTLDFLINGVVACTITEPPVQPTGDVYCPPSTGVGYSVGSYVVQSVYSGDTDYLPSSSPIFTVVIQPDPTSVNLASSPNASTVGQSVTFTAAIIDIYAIGQGTVNFFDGTAKIGSGTANAQGVATFSTSSLALGSHSITACLVASLNFLASNPCGAVTQIVNVVPPPPPPPPGPYTLTVNPSTISVGVGNTVTVQVTVTPTSTVAVSPPVQLACAGLPNETTCTFGQTLISAGGGSTTLTVNPAAPHTCGVDTPDFVAPNLHVGMAGLLLSVLALLGIRRRRRLIKGLVASVLLIAGLGTLSGLSGCGTKCKDFGTEPTNYKFTVTGTSTASPPNIQTVTVSMNVHL